VRSPTWPGGLAAKFTNPSGAARTHPIIGFRLAETQPAPPPSGARTGLAGRSGHVLRDGRATVPPVLCNKIDRVLTISVARDPLGFDLTRAEARAIFDHGFQTARSSGSTTRWCPKVREDNTITS
jgi:hypothetical protein